MRTVIQRVKSAKVEVNNKEVAKIKDGLLLLLGIGAKDTSKDVDKLVDKVLNLRIFEDTAEKMNLSLKNIKGEILVVPQFTLYANTDSGRRPSFEKAKNPKEAKALFEEFLGKLKQQGFSPQTGIFGEHMVISLENDGPVTIILDTE
ncbi:MAG: D-tyrosyl-tRNA(Tyr) deacylase [Candidatus Omnitrophica bacterium]|nr:D-tyrosyl-tRNA(Tyr) deacylase [Candidatus Omnitrophota bacterium]MBU1047562.1 D-tyrosyl-tRNA(Tyr) deacylase [Candidatus Omnitrophota bacterium]MBU1630494.1 D-tyrosyl-tRNA(Tyr) deacylase [Candidatus Omnitrophota bacterium]MBU1888925.1 D-tyrosyl-tRNA(Tyr) deacylase [Candidatus Omnitrophota bacterium]